MDNKALVKVPDCNKQSTGSSKLNRGFDFFAFPFFGPSIICIIIIGGPKTFSKYYKGLLKLFKNQSVKNSSQKKIDSGGIPGKPLLIPVAFSGIDGILSGVRGVDDDANILTAGTLTGLLYKASSGSLLSCGVGGLTGLLLSSMYCSLKPNNVVEESVEKKDYKDDYDSSIDDYWKPK